MEGGSDGGNRVMSDRIISDKIVNDGAASDRVVGGLAAKVLPGLPRNNNS